MVTVACVLNGGRYDETWVRKLKAGVERHLSLEHKFVCLANDQIDGVSTLPLESGWEGWWSKIELFRPGLLDLPVLYLDLDVMVCGDITPFTLVPNERFVMWREHSKKLPNSSVMFWSKDQPDIYNDFALDPDAVMENYGGDQFPRFDHFGDQAFISSYVTQDYWQDRFPAEWFHEFSRDNTATLDQPGPDVRLSVCLGNPKFDDHPDALMVREHWRL